MELALEQKGPVAPPPVLDGPSQRVAETIAAWPGVVAAAHWHLYNAGTVDGADFYLGERELGHIHLDGEVHLATDKALRDQALTSGEAERFPYGGSYATWVMTRIRTEADADRALRLFRRNYDRLAALGTRAA
jgi:Family of unknown function (DUF5519)